MSDFTPRLPDATIPSRRFWEELFRWIASMRINSTDTVRVSARGPGGQSLEAVPRQPTTKPVLPWEVYATGAATFTVAPGLLKNAPAGSTITNPAGYPGTISGTGTTKVYAKWRMGDPDGATVTDQAPGWASQNLDGWFYVFHTSSALDNDEGRFDNILIADIAHTSGVITGITQYHVGGAIPCPDPYALPGQYAWFNVPRETVIYGWRYIDTAEGLGIIGATASIAPGTGGGTLTLPTSELEAASGSGVTFLAPSSDTLPRAPYLALCLYKHLIPL